MRNPTARVIRDFITEGVATSPKAMSKMDRRLYRAAKRDYLKTPSNRKEDFYRNLAATVMSLRARRKKVAETIAAQSSAQSDY